MAMGQGAGDTEVLANGGEVFPLEGAAEEVNEAIGEMGEIGEGLMFDVGTVAEGAAEEIGDIGFALVGALDSGYMHTAMFGFHASNYRILSAASPGDHVYFTGYKRKTKNAFGALSCKDLRQNQWWNFGLVCLLLASV
jgi:hypothetical protein